MVVWAEGMRVIAWVFEESRFLIPLSSTFQWLIWEFWFKNYDDKQLKKNKRVADQSETEKIRRSLLRKGKNSKTNLDDLSSSLRSFVSFLCEVSYRKLVVH